MTYFFPTTLAFSSAELIRRFGVVTVEQDPNPAIHYQLIIPLDWEQLSGTGQFVTPEQPFELRSHFKSLAYPDSEMKVMVAYVAQEMSPSDWLALYLRDQHETVLHERHLPQRGGDIPDVLTQSGTAGHECLSRWLVLKDHASGGGAHLFIVQASAAASDYTTDVANVFLVLLSAFDLLHPVGWPYAEQLRSLTGSVPLPFTTAFPVSWQFLENPLSDEHFYQCKLLKDIDSPVSSCLSLMLLTGQTEADLHQLVKEGQAAFAEAGLEFGSAQLVPTPPISLLHNMLMDTMVQQQPGPVPPTYEWQVVVSRIGPQNWVYADCLRPTQESDPLAWAVSRQAFTILLEKLQLG